MSENKIKTYKDLVEEKERLQALLLVQKARIRDDFHVLKQEVKPAISAIAFLGKFTSRDKSSPLLTGFTNMVIDIVLKKLVLARAGWLPKLILPLFAKNASSHYIADNQNKIWNKIFSLFRHKNGKHPNPDTVVENIEKKDE